MANGIVQPTCLCLCDKFLINSHSRQTTVLTQDAAVSINHSELLDRVGRVRSVLRQRALQRGQVVAIALASSFGVLSMVLAAWSEGLAISLLPHELGASSGKLDDGRLSAMLELIEPALILCSEPIQQQLPHEWASRLLTDVALGEALGAVQALHEPARCVPADLAILQFTSGSTGMPKAVCISQAMLSANCQAIAERVGVSPQDRMVSWLPLHHDMGLSAITLAWWCGIDLVLMPTREFSRQPLAWLQALSHYKGTLSPAPTSAFALLNRLAGRVRDGELDLSAWRYAWVGAEPVFHDHLRQFETAFAPHGLRSGVVQPAYGMAEAVVAVSLNPPGQPLRVRWLDTRALHALGEVIELSEGAAGAAAYLGNGQVVDGVELRVADEHGLALGEGSLGHIEIRGTSVISQYLKVEPVRHQDNDWYSTGDLGFLLDNEIYITGRTKDLITRAGVNVSPQIIEWALESTLGLAAGSVAAFSCIDGRLARESVVVVMASNALAGRELDDLRREVARTAVRHAGVQVDDLVLIRRADFPRTTSGKIQRQALCRRYLSGELSSAAATPSPLSI
ncbi:AMP-binding protein [Pseudomonas gingeri]|uniref:AMP-binding protein n=2 Tax=Pseudomonas TaxID=286 RepID=A0A7Y8BL43_9PSED|nr:AMP-binding protein [Pseudomonas gingeri]NWB47699.1 AMP-binding protein [Pseudomonas gingeri]